MKTLNILKIILPVRIPVLVIFLIIPLTSFSQNHLLKFLNLQPKARFDSLELFAVQNVSDLDSLSFFRSLNQIKKTGLHKNDSLLILSTDYLRGIYYLYGKQTSKINTEAFLKNLVVRFSKLPETELRNILIGNIYHYLGLKVSRKNGQDGQRLKYFLSADLLHRKIGYEKIQFGGSLLNDIGQYYQFINVDFDKALEYYNEAEKYIKNDPIDLHRIFFYRSKAKTLVHFKRFEEALKYNKLGIAQVKLKKDSLRIGSLLGNMGEIILHNYPNPHTSEKYFLDELYYRKKYDPEGWDDEAKVYGNLCQVAALNKNAKLSDSLFNKAIKTLEPVKDTITKVDALRSIYLNKIIADTLLNNYASAFKYQQLYQQTVAFIFSEDLKKATSNAIVQFDTEKFRMEAELANQQNKSAKFWVAIISLLLMLAIIAAYLIYTIYNNSKKELAITLDLKKKEAEKLHELDNLKTRFFNNISHELKTPLTLIKAPLEELESKFGKTELIEMMKKNLHKLQTLINQILDLSKIEAGKMKVNTEFENLSIFIKNLVDSFDSFATSKKIKVDIQLPAEAILIHFDKDKIEKIVNNLLSNALKFTPENGTINVSLHNHNDSILIEIADNGVGISAEDKQKIFDRYYQAGNNTDLQNTGTGIGLALVSELVNVLNGSIEIESELGQGSVFRVTLPYDKSLENTSEPKSEYQESSPTQNDQDLVLIVEDNTDIRTYLRKSLGETHAIIEAENGEVALSMALQQMPDIIITDLMMPKKDGLELIKAIRADIRLCHIPVIMLSAKADLESRIDGYEGGADDYLAKPFSPLELKTRISNLLNNRKLLFEKYKNKDQSSNPIPDLNEIFLKEVNDRIEKNISDNKFRLEDLADAMDLSSIQLRRKLKAITGTNPTEYIRNFRLEKAAYLLKQKNDTISEVAYKVGFESLSYFSKVFNEKYDKLPSEW